MEPISRYKKKVIEHLEKLEKPHIVDRPTSDRLYPGEAITVIYGRPKIHKAEETLTPSVASTRWRRT